MLRRILCLALMCGVIMTFGCGEDEEPLEEEETLSELIVGSWRSADPELGLIFVPFEGGTLIGEMSSTLTFYAAGRFDNVFEVSITLDGAPIGNMKAITYGSYEAFDGSVAFRAESSETKATPPDFQAMSESDFSSMAEGLESMFTDSLPASVQGQTLMLDGSPWQRI